MVHALVASRKITSKFRQKVNMRYNNLTTFSMILISISVTAGNTWITWILTFNKSISCGFHSWLQVLDSKKKIQVEKRGIFLEKLKSYHP